MNDVFLVVWQIHISIELKTLLQLYLKWMVCNDCEKIMSVWVGSLMFSVFIVDVLSMGTQHVDCFLFCLNHALFSIYIIRVKCYILMGSRFVLPFTVDVANSEHPLSIIFYLFVLPYRFKLYSYLDHPLSDDVWQLIEMVVSW